MQGRRKLPEIFISKKKNQINYLNNIEKMLFHKTKCQILVKIYAPKDITELPLSDTMYLSKSIVKVYLTKILKVFSLK